MKRYLLFLFLACFCLTGCEKFGLTSKTNALIFKPASSLTRSDNAVEEEGTIVYSIGCAWSGISGHVIGVDHRGLVTGEYLFEEGSSTIQDIQSIRGIEDFAKIDSPLVSIMSVHYSLNPENYTYSKKYPENIQVVYIYGEPARLFGGDDCLAFLINQDPYGNDEIIENAQHLRGQNLDNELIKSIKFKTYKITSDKDTETSYADIDIVITSKKGDTIRIVYSGQLLPSIGINAS